MRNLRSIATLRSLLRPLCVLVVAIPASSQIEADLSINAKELHAIDRRIYGQYVEHFGRIVQGGLWAELLRNRKFYPIDPDRSNVADPWKPDLDRTFVSYGIDRSVTLDGISAQRVLPSSGSAAWRGISQSGFDVIAGKQYVAYAWIKGSGGAVSFRLESGDGKYAAHAEVQLAGGEWRKYEVHITPEQDLRPAVFRIAFNTAGLKWIGAVSLMPADNVDGLRPDVLALIKAMKPTIFRWPGGGYPDSYDWRKAIGPRDRRPPQDILPFGQPNGYDHGMDSNDFGTDEFLRFCERVGAEPYITANFGSGSPDMAASWVQYTNGKAASTWGARRVANGRVKPYGVKHWSIGNETWGPFEVGYSNGRGYAEYYIPMARAMRSADPSIQITAVGRFDTADRREWNEPVLENAWRQMDMLSLHHYYPGGFRPAAFEGHPLDFYHAVVAEPTIMEQGLRGMIAMIDRVTAGRKQIQISLDEWNEWDWDYPAIVARPDRDQINQFIDLINLSGLEMNQTARDGLYAARVLHVLMRLSPRVPIGVRTHMINSLGAIRTDSTRAFITASGRTMELYSNYSGPVLLDTTQRSGTFSVSQTGWHDIPYLDSAATLSADRKTLFIHVINLHPSERMRVHITLGKERATGNATVYQIASDDFLARNDFDANRVAIRSTAIQIAGSKFDHEVPPHSITTLVMPVVNP